MHRAPAEGRADAAVAQPHDRQKPRLLEPADPVWRALGIADDRSVIKPSRQRKYRQVEEFLRLLDAGVTEASAAGVLPPVSSTRPLQVVDLGCGNAYLTFAAFQFLSSARELPVRMLGVDRSEPARERNDRLAAELGWTDRLRFIEGSIATAELDVPPDVVLSLHACDTATDEALARAVRSQTPLVLAAPCCHHDLQTQLRRAAAPPPYALMLRQGILRERFADVLTDALRAALLRLLGYRVDVVQFVDSEDTPRNVLLRAVRTGSPPPVGLRQEYAQLTADWSVTPALERMLVAEVAEALAS